MENRLVKLIAGKFDNGIVNYWITDLSFECEIGDFIIVENRSAYALVEIVGVTYTRKKQARYFSNTNYENMKKVVKLIRKEELEKRIGDDYY